MGVGVLDVMVGDGPDVTVGDGLDVTVGGAVGILVAVGPLTVVEIVTTKEGRSFASSSSFE